MYIKVSIDAEATQKAVEELSTRRMVNAFRAGFRKTNRIVQRSVQTSYRAHFPGSVLYKDVHAKEFRSGKGAITDLKYIGRRKKGPQNGRKDKSHSWIMHLLATGTAPRKAYIRMMTRHGCWGLNRGAITPNAFFEEGVKASQAQAQADMQKNLEEAIIKQAKKAGLAAS